MKKLVITTAIILGLGGTVKADVYNDLNCIAGLSVVKDWAYYKDKGLYREATDFQNKFYLKYEPGHRTINSKNIDRVKKQLFKNKVKLAGPWVANNCL